MAQALTPHKLSRFNLKRKPFRTYALTIVVSVLSFVLFGGSLVSISLKNGLGGLEARFGADLIVVPLGHESDQKALLLTGKPSYFYFDKGIADKLKELDGISKLSTQFYLTALSASCCSVPVQIIGIDPASDFTISPWIKESVGGNIEKGALIVGSDIELEDNKHIRFFDKDYPVAARLDETGTGLDQSVFASIETIKDLYQRARQKGLNFLAGTDPEGSISTVLIKVKDGYGIERLITDIRRSMDGVQIIKTQGLIGSISRSLGNFISFFKLFAITFLVITLLILSVVFSATANERKKEFATLRLLGATRKRLAAILLWESLYISGTGGVIGTGIAAAIVFPFNVYIADRIGLPYLMPSPIWIATLLTGSLITAVAVGPTASAYLAVKLCRPQTYLTFREGE